jgi:predicted nucleic acid-binding protein
VRAFYLDSSALVKLFFDEAGTEQVKSIASGNDTSLLLASAFTRVEVRAALRRRERTGDLTPDDTDRLVRRVELFFETRVAELPVTDPVLRYAESLADRHPLKAYDAIQLAVFAVQREAVDGPSLVFVCADRQLTNAANTEGYATIQPA